MHFRLISSILVFSWLVPAHGAMTDNSLFTRVVEEAKKQKLDEKSEVRRKMDEVLYEEYVSNIVRAHKEKIEPTEADLRSEYEKAPLIRMRHLTVKSEKPAPLPSQILQVQKQLARGADFEKLVMKHSDDASAFFGGDTDFRGRHNFPENYYTIALKLKKGEVSAPFFDNGAFHLLQRTDTKKYEDMFPVYRVYLSNRIRNQRKETLLQETVATQ